MKFIKILMMLILLYFINLGAETPFNWGKDELLARRLKIKQEAYQNRQDSDTQFSVSQVGRPLSIGRAVLFSAVIPGSGQFYAKSYIKAALFFAFEIGAWAVNISYDKKGDDKVNEFEQYANTNWNEFRYWSYVNWIASNDERYNDLPLARENNILVVSAPNGGNWYLINEDYYNANRDELLAILKDIEKNEFSHRLPADKTQQYFEMIGKYPVQFGNAWIDADFDRNYRGPSNITVKNDLYMTMREDSNRFYDVAQYGLMVALVNHVASAIDAGFTARNYNRRQLQLEMSYNNFDYKGEFINMFGLNMKW
jgi:hypothetical protein